MGDNQQRVHQDKLKYDTAGAHDFVFSGGVNEGSRRGWDYIRAYNDWLNQG